MVDLNNNFRTLGTSIFQLFRNDTEKICVYMLTVNRTNQVENKNNIVGR